MMPEPAPAVLLVSITDVLDRSALGRAGARMLEERFGAARARRQQIQDLEQAARFEADAVRELEAERARLRDEVLARARAICSVLREERGAAVVLDRSVALAFGDGVDVTEAVIARLDRG